MQQESTKTNKTNPTKINNQSKEYAMSAGHQNSKMDLTKNIKQTKKETAMKNTDENQSSNIKEYISHEKSKGMRVIRGASKRRVDSLGLDYGKILEGSERLEKEITTYKQQIKDKKIVIEPVEKGGEKITKYFTPVEIDGLRGILAEKKVQLKISQKKLKSFGARFSKASKSYAASKKAQTTRFNIKASLNHKAIKNSGTIWGISDSTFEKLIENNDPRIDKIKELSSGHVQKINSAWYGILKEELTGIKVANENVVDLLKASPSVRSKLAKRVANRISR